MSLVSIFVEFQHVFILFVLCLVHLCYLFQSMYALMAKCEELTQNMEPVYKLADQMYPFTSNTKRI